MLAICSPSPICKYLVEFEASTFMKESTRLRDASSSNFLLVFLVMVNIFTL